MMKPSNPTMITSKEFAIAAKEGVELGLPLPMRSKQEGGAILEQTFYPVTDYEDHGETATIIALIEDAVQVKMVITKALYNSLPAINGDPNVQGHSIFSYHDVSVQIYREGDSFIFKRGRIEAIINRENVNDLTPHAALEALVFSERVGPKKHFAWAGEGLV